MNLDIQAIADSKIQLMHDTGEIRERIEDDVSKVILKAVDDAIDDYSIRNAIEESVSKDISAVLKKVDFTTYNGFIAEKIKELTEGILRADISNKLQEEFKNIFIEKRDKVKLSEILNAYRDWICEDTDEQEKYELENFYVKMEDKAPEFNWIDFTLSKEKPDSYSYHENEYFRFTAHRGFKDPKNIGFITSVIFGDTPLDKALTINPNKFQAFIMNLVYNKTPVEIDIEDEGDIDDSFDVDI